MRTGSAATERTALPSDEGGQGSELVRMHCVMWDSQDCDSLAAVFSSYHAQTGSSASERPAVPKYQSNQNGNGSEYLDV